MIDFGLGKIINDTFTEDSENGLGAATDEALQKGLDKASRLVMGDQKLQNKRDEFKDKHPDRKDMRKSDQLDMTLGAANDHLGAIGDHLNRNTVSTASIISRSKNSVAQFPVYITTNVTIDEAQTLSKMYERVYATLVQTVIAQNPIVDEGDVNSLSFLKQFHTNLREAAEVFVNKYYRPIDGFDEMMCESIFYSANINDDVYIEFQAVPTVDTNLIMENARLMNEPLSGFSYLRESVTTRYMREDTDTFNDVISDGHVKIIINEENIKIDKENREIRKRNEEIKRENEKINDPNKRKKLETPIEHIKDEKDLYNRIKQGYRVRSTSGQDKNGNTQYMDISAKEVEGKIFFFGGKNKVTVDSNKEKTMSKPINAPATPKILTDDGVKKLNGMLPYSIEVTLHVRSGGEHNSTLKEMKFIIGVKTVLHLIKASDLADDLREIITGDMKGLQKVRYKTGEITTKEYLFNTKQLKADASKHINYSKRWLNTLKRLGEYDKMNGSLLKKPIEWFSGGEVPIPNGTMILHQIDIDTLTARTGIDLTLVSNAKRLAKTLFLISIAIIDGDSNTVKILNTDTDVAWDVQSYSSISAEIAKTDNTRLINELQNLANKR